VDNQPPFLAKRGEFVKVLRVICNAMKTLDERRQRGPNLQTG